MKLDKLPIEILYGICDALHSSEPGFPSSIDENSCNLKALRLVSRYFRDVPVAALFKTILFHPHPERWSMLANVANAPELAEHVRHLEVVNIEVLSCVHPLDDWTQCFYLPYRGDYDILAYPRHGIGSTYARSFDGSNGSADTEDIVEKHYRKYRYWADGGREMELLLRAGSVPLFDLHKLPNLRAITTLDRPNIVKIPVREWSERGAPVAQPGNIVFVDRYDIDSGARNTNKVEPVHLEYAIGAVRQSTAALPSLVLHHSCEVMRMWPNSPSLSHLRRLVIARPYRGLSENKWSDRTGKIIIHQDISIRRNDLATWVKELPSLHTLEITQSTYDHELLNLLHFLKGRKYPNLKVLYLKRVLSFATDLRQFIFAHMDNLESLTIDTPAIFTSEWETLKEEIEHKAPASCRLQLTGSFKPSMSRRNQERMIPAWWDRFPCAQVWWDRFHEHMIEETTAG